jgi:hypothetical protein
MSRSRRYQKIRRALDGYGRRSHCGNAKVGAGSQGGRLFPNAVTTVKDKIVAPAGTVVSVTARMTALPIVNIRHETIVVKELIAAIARLRSRCGTNDWINRRIGRSASRLPGIAR